MRKPHLTSSLACVLLAVASDRPAEAHEGHGHVAAVEYDLTLPRRPSPEARRHIGIEVAATEIRLIEDVTRFSGVVRLDPDRRATASSRHAGLVVAVAKRIGDVVAQGDVLARIDSPERARAVFDLRQLEVQIAETRLEVDTARGEVESASAEIAAAEQRLVTGRAARDRARQLEQGGTVTRAEIEERESVVAELESRLVGVRVGQASAARRQQALEGKLAAIEVSRAALASMFNLDSELGADAAPDSQFEIVAPRGGVVLRANAVPGDWVAAGAPIFEIADLSTVLVEGRLPERELASLAIAPGATARIRLDRHAAGPPLGKGRVRYLGSEVDAVTRTVVVGVEVENPEHRLRAEQYVEVAVVTGSRGKALAVPRSALMEMGSLAFVFVENGDEFVKQDVAVGSEDDEAVEILAGLAPNDRVVTRGAFALTQLRPEGVAAPAESTDDGHGH